MVIKWDQVFPGNLIRIGKQLSYATTNLAPYISNAMPNCVHGNIFLDIFSNFNVSEGSMQSSVQ